MVSLTCLGSWLSRLRVDWFHFLWREGDIFLLQPISLPPESPWSCISKAMFLIGNWCGVVAQRLWSSAGSSSERLISGVLYIKLKTKELITIISERPINYLEETCKPRSMKHSPSSIALLSSMVCTFLSDGREWEREVLIIGGGEEAKWAFWIWKRKPRSYSAVKSVMCIINLSLCFFLSSHLCFFLGNSHLYFWKRRI
jgi:hypothetical protein